MSKVSFVASLLMEGQRIEKYKEVGNSMLPILKSNQAVTLEPMIDSTNLEISDIVFCRVKGNYCTHLISEMRNKNGYIEYQISNNRKFINGRIKKRIFIQSS